MMIKQIIALYLRLSHKDAEIKSGEESNSIHNQRELLEEYISKHQELSQYAEDSEKFEVREFVDDGYSGTNFERPAVKELLELVRQGRVSCIIVKDLSRFGRNYIEAGTYLEQLFPYIGVRFISINDTYDSIRQEGQMPGMDVSFKGIIHDYYCKELSRKCKIARIQQNKKGRSVMARPPYGYWKSETQKGKLVVDRESAAVVKHIFEMFLDGMSAYRIAKTLNEEGIASPNKRLEQNGLVKFDKAYSANLSWSQKAVLSILRNEVYIGNVVGNKCKRTKIAVKSWEKLNEEQWIVVEDMHEPIIGKDDFEKVQLILQNNKPMSPAHKKSDNLYKGKLVCGVCHSIMVKNGENNGNTYYVCSRCRQAGGNIVIVHSNDLENEVLQGISKKEEMQDQLSSEIIGEYIKSIMIFSRSNFEVTWQKN